MRPFKTSRAALALALALAALAAGCPQTDLPPEGETRWDCSDGADNDVDGGFDCDDAGCAWWEGCDGSSDLDDTGDDDTSEEEDPVDADGDGWPAGEDCDDLNPDVYPGAEEICDGLDTNCDNVVDPEDWDRDGDGLSQCQGDCDDTRWDVYPGALEVCDGVDNNCDGTPELDEDRDGFFACEDCNDANPDVSPGTAEICNGMDDNCDGLFDEGFPTDPYWPDEDDDDFGDEHSPAPLELCFDPGFRWAGNPEDCDDDDHTVHPGATEFCNGADDDCDTAVDEDGVCEEPSECGPYPLDGYYPGYPEGVSSDEVPGLLQFSLSPATATGELSGDGSFPVVTVNARAICDGFVLPYIQFFLTTPDGSWYSWMDDIDAVRTEVSAFSAAPLWGTESIDFGPGRGRTVSVTDTTVVWTVWFPYDLFIPEGTTLSLTLSIHFGDVVGDWGAGVVPGPDETFVAGMSGETSWWGEDDPSAYPTSAVGEDIMGLPLTYVPD